ncbi:DUF4349 domain-containing protein [Ornithinimicrobium avium]|uniref:DUF4349 domain-containing protein n=1 Tax=Ornithinimicrobium avium TaxID=2283195 RepID=A0A345NJX8_9MICO|nr:DUF4349 domain-containing protein [Ornithinimicrobium avium]AXH95336.1 DUF4349 domain-containing protein [Ornithinimicrobium avium]
MDTRKRVLAPLLLILALVLGACSASGGSAGTAADQAQADGAVGMDAGAPAEQPAADESAADGSEARLADGGVEGLVAQAAVAGDGAPLMVRTVDVELLVEDVLEAVSRTRAAVVAVDGWVSSEEVRPGADDDPGWATLVLRVPSADLDATVTTLGDLGKVTSSRSSAEDVTTEYRDVEARVATLEASAARLRDLVQEAGSVESIANLERELAAREADLDALKARMKVLQEDVSRSTITLHLAEDAATLAQTVPRTGFLAGLQQGWAAFTASVTLLLTALGGVLPFAVVAALVALPLLAWRRRVRRGTRPGSREASPGPSPAVPDGAAD